MTRLGTITLGDHAVHEIGHMGIPETEEEEVERDQEHQHRDGEYFQNHGPRDAASLPDDSDQSPGICRGPASNGLQHFTVIKSSQPITRGGGGNRSRLHIIGDRLLGGGLFLTLLRSKQRVIGVKIQ